MRITFGMLEIHDSTVFPYNVHRHRHLHRTLYKFGATAECKRSSSTRVNTMKNIENDNVSHRIANNLFRVVAFFFI